MDAEMSISEDVRSKSIAELESRLTEVDAELVEYQALEKLVAVGLQEARLKHESSERALESLRMQVITIESQVEVRKKTHEQDKERIRVRLSTLQQHLETVKLKRIQLEDELSKETRQFDQESSDLAERIERLEKEVSEAEIVREDMINALKENDRAQIWAGRIQSIHTLLYGTAQPRGVKLIKQLADSNTSKFIEELAAKYGDTFTTTSSAPLTTRTTTTKKSTKAVAREPSSPKVEAINHASNKSEMQVKKSAGKRFRSTELDTLIRDHALAGSLQHATFQDKKQADDMEEYSIEPIVKRTRSSNSRSSEEATGEKHTIASRVKSKKNDEDEDDEDDNSSLSSDDSSAASTKAVKVSLDKPTTRGEEVYSRKKQTDTSPRLQRDSAMKSPRRSVFTKTRRQANRGVDSGVSTIDTSPSLTVSSTTPVKKRRRRENTYDEQQDGDDDDEEEEEDDDSVTEDKRRRKLSKLDEASSKATPRPGRPKHKKKRTLDDSSSPAAAAAASSSQTTDKPLHWTQELKQMKKERENKDYSKVTCSECPDITDKEDLILCDRCDQGYHLSCANLSEIPSNWFICKYCKAKSAIKTKQARRDYERRNYQARRERQRTFKKEKVTHESAKSSSNVSKSNRTK